MKFISLLSLFLFQLTYAQDKRVLLENKIRPVTFQVEKTLATALRDRLANELTGDKFGIEVKLKVEVASVAQKAGLSLDSSTKALPGLDESKQIIDSKLINFQPTSSDIISSTSSLSVQINSGVSYSKEQKEEIRKLIESELSTLGIKTITVGFIMSKSIVSIADKKESNKESPFLPQSSSNSQQDSLRPLLFTLIASVIIFSGLVAFSLFLGFQKIEKLSKDVSSGLSNLALASTGPQPINSNPAQRAPETVSRGQAESSNEKYDDLLKKLQSYFSKTEKVQEYFNFIIDINDFSKMIVLMESVSDEVRVSLITKLPEDFKKRYEPYIARLNQEQELEKTLFISAKEMVSDTKMMNHDSSYLTYKALKQKIQLIKRDQVRLFFAECDESEFSQVIQLMDPIIVASTLSQDPGLIDRFKFLSGQKLNEIGLRKLSEKLNRFMGQVSDQFLAHKIANFLPPELEAEFNRKMGKSTTIWDELSEDQLLRLEAFARSLAIAQLSALLAITPDPIKSRILNRLPDIKSQQLQRFGIKLTDESFKLKNDFFSQNESGIVQ